MKIRLYTLKHLALQDPEPDELVVEADNFEPIYEALGKRRLARYYFRWDWIEPDGTTGVQWRRVDLTGPLESEWGLVQEAGLANGGL